MVLLSTAFHLRFLSRHSGTSGGHGNLSYLSTNWHTTILIWRGTSSPRPIYSGIHSSNFVWAWARRQSRQTALWCPVVPDPVVGSRMREGSRNCTCRDPSPAALGKSWKTGGVPPPLESYRPALLSCSQAHLLPERTLVCKLQVQTSCSLQVVRGWALLPPLALTGPHLGSPGLCCTSKLCGSHLRRCGLRKFRTEWTLHIW